MTKIKICGITNLRDALLASDLGADALGFIFAPSPRQISPERAREIISRLPPFVHKVGVLMNESISEAKEIMDYCSLDFVQLHGGEDRCYLKQLGQRAIKVFEMNKRELLNEIRIFSLPFFMLDLPKDAENKNNIDWTMAQKAKKFGKIILAGGLKPENVEMALRKAAPYGVDVCRGVEEEYGVKSPEKLKEFIEKVRQWDILKT